MMLADGEHRYGLVSRTLHWAMAVLFVWQFTGMALKLILGRVPLTGFWVGTHASVGSLLFLLILIRVAWALVQSRRRPDYGTHRMGRLAAAGHIALYSLMLVVPTLSLIRLFGSERAIRLFGVPIRPETAQEVKWMTAPADLMHGYLAWLLLILIAGHIGMALIHHYIKRDGILYRMIGRSPAATAPQKI